ncbi:GNAT family N-acetyltransferase [Nocardioides flavescens]|uniref:GNAT family N-acetyltransferase n=1 Tax=Nocardioides flavescens TaxID=2691959 RepID=A0A6L7F3H7_9ACTN|nr:GNAT family N-acetyltransferase [Nocardioides flavescens]
MLGEPPVVTACETAETLAAASKVFDAYRCHYGQPADAAQTLRWLTRMTEAGLLTVFTAALEDGTEPVGLATAHPVPASLGAGLTWQLRDLYVDPRARRRGVARALVTAVRRAGEAAGASRLSLVTEVDNAGALGLYECLGFRPVTGFTTLSLDLAAAAAAER